MGETWLASGSADGGEVARPSPELAAALDSLPVPAWISAPDANRIHFNRAWFELTGRTPEQEAGVGWTAGVHPEDQAPLERSRDAVTSRLPIETEFRLRRRDGSWRWLLDRAAPRFAPDGEFLGFIGCCTDVTDRREVEQALRSSEERLRLAQDAAGVGTYDWDIATGRINWSPGRFQLHGIDPATPPEDLYSAWLERLHPDDRDRADRETREFVRAAESLDIEFRVVRPDGTTRWLQGRGRTYRDPSGRPLRMIGATFDVTERRAAEEALRESEQRLRDISEHFPGVVFRRVTYPDGRVEYPYFSGADDRILHLPRERLGAIRSLRDVAGLVHDADLDDLLARYGKAAADLTPLEVEGRIISDDGEVRRVRSISRPRRGQDGAIIWDGILLDVTDQHREQVERERAATMLRMGMEVAGIGTWEFDPEARTITGSPVTQSVFGLPDDDRPRPLDDYIRAVHPDDAERVLGGLIEGAARGTPTAREYRVVSEKGDVRWILSHASFVRLADGSERQIGALYDITERKKQDETREAALRQQEVLLKELDHRVKNNLQMVTSVLQLQAARLQDPMAREQFGRAIQRVQTIADLHSQLGFASRLGKIEFGDYLHQLCHKLQNSVLAESRVELRCTAVRCPIDPDQAVPLGLMVNELVTNAIKHAFPEGAAGVISIRLDRDAGDLVLTVADNGDPASDGHKSGGGLGTRLIEGLSKQVGAVVETRSGPGYTTIIRMPDSCEAEAGE